MKSRKDDSIWRKAFGDTLKKIIVLYSLDYHDFCKKYNISEATFRYWMLGKKYIVNSTSKQISKFMEHNNIFNHYQLLCFTRENLRALYYSKDKVAWLNEYFLEMLEPSV